jgi:hypothetical protein
MASHWRTMKIDQLAAAEAASIFGVLNAPIQGVELPE